MRPACARAFFIATSVALLCSALEVRVGKFLLLLAMVCVVWWLWRHRGRALEDTSASSREKPEQAMVPCAHCGVYLPLAESLGEGEWRFCSQEHLLAGPRRQS